MVLIGASNAQLDGVFGGSDFLLGVTVPQLLTAWDQCSAWTASFSRCGAKIGSIGKVACNCAGHSSQHVTQHHANLASPPFNRAVQFSRFLLEPLTDTHRVLLLLLGLSPVEASTLLVPEIWQMRCSLAVEICNYAEDRQLAVVLQAALLFIRTQAGIIYINARVLRPGLPAEQQRSLRAAMHSADLLLEWCRRTSAEQPSPTQQDIA